MCVFTHSVHGVECAREVWAAWRAHFLLYTDGSGDGQGSEIFSPCINADIRTPSSLLMSSRKCALTALHVIAEEGRKRR